MKRQNARPFLAGALTALLGVSMIPAALALTNKKIDVSTGIRIFVNDSQINPTDSAGNPIEAFIYNGTTYLPVRAVSDALGTPVQWDGGTQSVYIGSHSSSTPAAYLGQMDYFDKNCSWRFDSPTTDNLGNTHMHSIEKSNSLNGEPYVTYKLNGQYNRLTASYYMKYEKRSSYKDRTFTLLISGDGKDLWQGEVGAGIDPVNIDIDITGVLELTIKYPESTIRDGEECTALGEVALYT